jgi:hypothetical protein
MEVASTKASLVGTRDFADSVTATIPRAEFEAALATDEPAELFIEVKQPSGDTGDLAVAWDRADLERLLSESTGPTVTLAFDRDELEGVLADVEAHGIRQKALILTVAAAAAAGGASIASAGNDELGSTARGITPSYVAVHDEATLAERGIAATPLASTHDEATLAARGIEAGTPAASHDEATLAARGIEAGTPAASHDEATLAARGIEAGTPAASHEEATLAARGIEAGTLAATHDEATLAARGIEAGTLASTHDEASLAARGIEAVPMHDEATLAARGIEAPPATHDEATLAARGIEPGSLPATHDEATLTARGIAPVTPADDSSGGLSIDAPAIDATTAAYVGGAAGLGLLITAAGFAARRQRVTPA